MLLRSFGDLFGFFRYQFINRNGELIPRDWSQSIFSIA